MHYVAVKSAEHQARAVAFRTHQCFVRQRTDHLNLAVAFATAEPVHIVGGLGCVSDRIGVRHRVHAREATTSRGRGARFDGLGVLTAWLAQVGWWMARREGPLLASDNA